jgi:hypothetical protein
MPIRAAKKKAKAVNQVKSSNHPALRNSVPELLFVLAVRDVTFVKHLQKW